jgi:hypothetical protein
MSQQQQLRLHGGDVVVLNAPVRAPPLNETLQLALGPLSTNGSKSKMGKLVSLLASEPGIGVCDTNARERTANIITSAPFFMNGVDLMWQGCSHSRVSDWLQGPSDTGCHQLVF